MEEIKILLGFSNCFTVDRLGRGSGLSLVWSNSVHAVITRYSLNHIDMKISGLGVLDWHLTGFYGCPEHSKYRLSWNLLRALSRLHDLPWLCIRDYNDRLLSSEKSGGNLHL